MSTHDTEICGFLDVKLIGKRYVAQKVRKRTLILSKVWKRSWCSVKKLGPGLGLQIQFDQKLSCRDNPLKNEKENSMIIPSNVIIHRIRSRTKQFAFSISSAVDRKSLLSLSANSETETQRWMANIRHLLKLRRHCCSERSYDISMVDNAHSKAAGLTGLYGYLIANETGIFIKNVHTGEIAKTFKWEEFTQFHLMTAGRPEDVKRICVIHTSKEFCCGIGELHIFCLNANKLLQDLVTQGRGPKHRQKSLHSDSENLEAIGQSEISSLPSQLKSDTSLCILNTDANCLRTSIGTKVVENLYQSEPNLAYSEKLYSCNHKESNTSIASGIYEEIIDETCFSKPKISFTSNEYKNTKIPCSLRMEPPALPPRQHKLHVEEDRMDTEQYFQQEISNHFKTRSQNTCTQKITLTDHSSYVPMSPQLRDNTLESDISENSKENDYVIMR